MTRFLSMAYGGEINEAIAYHWHQSSVPSGWSLDSTPAPPVGTYWMKKDGTAGDNWAMGQGKRLDLGHHFSAAPKRSWLTGHFRVEKTTGTIDATTELDGARGINLAIPSTMWFSMVGTAGGKYKVKLHVNGGVDTDTGTTEYSIDTNHDFRFSCNGTTITLEVDGIEECSITDSDVMDTDQVFVLKAGKTGVQQLWSGLCLWHSDADGDDRPDVDAEVVKMYPTGDGALTEWGTAASTCTNNAADYTAWDDWAGSGTQDNDDSCGDAASGDEQLCTTNNPSFTGGLSLEGGVMIWLLNNTGANKTTNAHPLCYDGTTKDDHYAGVDYGVNAEVAEQHAFPDLGGSAWTQTKLNNLEIGMRAPGGNDDALVDAIAFEAWAVSDDAGGDPVTISLPHMRQSAGMTHLLGR